MMRVRHVRGTLAVVCASVLRCFVAPQTKQLAVLRKPVRAMADETRSAGNTFWACIQQAACDNKTDPEAYVTEVQRRAGQCMNSSHVVDRTAAVEALVRAMASTGAFTVVLGGKNLGKTFLTKAAVRNCSSDVVVLSANMRNMPGDSLLDAILMTANRSLEGLANQKDFSQSIANVAGVISAIASAMENLGPAATPVANLVKESISGIFTRSQVRRGIDAFLEMMRESSKRNAIVVDEANLGLPGLTNGQDSAENREAKSALAAITAWTKEQKLTSVMLISSEFAYPFRLQATGLDFRDITKTIVIGEVPEPDMLTMLQEDWGMKLNLAKPFHKYYSGKIYTTKLPLDMLIDKKDEFYPFAVLLCPGLPSCAQNARARAHLENIAKQGFSLVEDAKTDEGAEMIAEENLGGVISRNAITFGLPDIFNGPDRKWAVIPSTYHMKLLIHRELPQIPLPKPGRCFRNGFSCVVCSVLLTLSGRRRWMEVK